MKDLRCTAGRDKLPHSDWRRSKLSVRCWDWVHRELVCNASQPCDNQQGFFIAFAQRPYHRSGAAVCDRKRQTISSASLGTVRGSPGHGHQCDRRRPPSCDYLPCSAFEVQCRATHSPLAHYDAAWRGFLSLTDAYAMPSLPAPNGAAPGCCLQPFCPCFLLLLLLLSFVVFCYPVHYYDPRRFVMSRCLLQFLGWDQVSRNHVSEFPANYTGNQIVAHEFLYNVTNQLVYNQSGVQVYTSCQNMVTPAQALHLLLPFRAKGI